MHIINNVYLYYNIVTCLTFMCQLLSNTIKYLKVPTTYFTFVTYDICYGMLIPMLREKKYLSTLITKLNGKVFSIYVCIIKLIIHTPNIYMYKFTYYMQLNSHIGRLQREILMRVCVCMIPAFGFVRSPLCRYTL